MANLTLSLDDQVIKKVRRIALERDTTLTAMVRDYLEQVAQGGDASQEQRARELQETLLKFSRPMGGKDWSRDELYE